MIRRHPFVFLAIVGVMIATLFGAFAQSASATTITDHDFIPSLSDTRSAGHYQATASGLHIWTDPAPATSMHKVAEYVAVPTAPTLVGVATHDDPSVVWTGTSTAPGFQLVGHYDGHPFILVGESVYGDKWWMPNGFCSVSDPTAWCHTLPITYQTSGGGSIHSATLAQWSAGMPGAMIDAIGFSLGSGVVGDGTVKALVYNGTSYNFGVYKPPVTTPTSTTSTTAPDDNPTTTPPTTVSSTPTSTTSTTSSSPVAQPIVATTTSTDRTMYVPPVRTDTKALAYTGAGDVIMLAVLGGTLLLVGVATMFIVRVRRRQVRPPR